MSCGNSKVSIFHYFTLHVSIYVPKEKTKSAEETLNLI